MNILITGGASGLGEAILKKLAVIEDNHIFFTYAKSAESAARLTNSFKNATALHCDFTDESSVDDLVGKLEKCSIDILINNSVTSLTKEHFQKIEPDKFLFSFQHNIMPVVKITQECIKIFRKKKFGKIITIASSAIINRPPAGWSEYTANKAYLVSLSKSWATENIRFNITSNCISPSYMHTSLTAGTDERIEQEIINSHPLKKLLTPEEVAETVFFLSGCSQHINGINLIMNAGTDII
jgi:3-oxoacyl-[acyl-carrier protein] reductase